MNQFRALRVLGFFAPLLIFGGTSFALTIRVADWNVGNKPNNATDDSQFQTILNYMSTVRHVDVMALAETDTGSAPSTAADFNALYGGSSYLASVAASDGGGDKTGFIYNSSTLQLLNTKEVGDGSLTHPSLRAEFRPIGTTGSQDFYYYAVHLKSGSTTAIRTSRGAEAAVLRADADSLGEGGNIIMGGDFNWQSADETVTSGQSAYRAFNAPGAGQVADVVNQVGSWHANAAYKSLHTEAPATNMDDRFDMQLVSGGLQDGLNLDYLPGSYSVVGNNGTHVLGSSIDTGTGAPSNVLAALEAFSDHIPVMADYLNIIPGDFNYDGKVDIADLGILATHYGQAGNVTFGDANGDGQVNIADLGLLATDYGSGTSGPQTALADAEQAIGIPEPTMTSLAVIALSSFLDCRRRQSR